MQSSKKSPKTSGISSAATKTVKSAAPVKKAPAAKKPAVKTATAVKKAPAVKQTAVVKKTPVAKKPAGKHKHVKFQLQTKPGSKVYLGGDFNEWNHLLQELIDQDGNGVYEVVIALEPGVYEYKFHINDNWCVDPDNPNFRPNVMGTLNSVIIVE